MKFLCRIFLLVIFSHNVSAQKYQEISIAFINTGTAYPFDQFGKLLTNLQHPGVELAHIAAVLGLIVNFLFFENFLQGMLRRGVHAKIV